MKTPLVSTVVPLYNKGPHIERCLNSVLSQTMSDFEIIVVDDGSTDNGAEIVLSFADPRIRLFRQTNQGVSIARNRGVREAQAPLVSFLDADDAYAPDFLSDVIRLGAKHPSAVGFAFNYAEACEVKGAKDARVAVTAIQEEYAKLDMRLFFNVGKFGTPIFTSSTAVRKEALLHAGAFPPGVRLGEDLDTWIRLLSIGDFVFCNAIGSYYFTDAVNRACRINNPSEHYVFFDTIDKWVSKNPLSDSQMLNDILDFKAQFLIGYAHHSLLGGNHNEARRVALECSTTLYKSARARIILQSYIPPLILAAMRDLMKRTRVRT